MSVLVADGSSMSLQPGICGVLTPRTPASAGEAAAPLMAATPLADSPWAVAAVLALWVATGLLTAHVIGRRGHDKAPIVGLGAAFGPLLIPLAVDLARREKWYRGAILLEPGRPGAGNIDVLAAFDGNPGRPEAFRRALALLGSRVRRLTLARVIDYDSAQRGDWDHAASELATWASCLPGHAPELVLIPGAPGTAVFQYAGSEGFDVLVVPSGWEGRLVRSSPRAPTAASPLPVLVVGANHVAGPCPEGTPPARDRLTTP